LACCQLAVSSTSLLMEDLGGTHYVRHLPTLKDSPKAVLTMKKGNIPFGETDLAAIVLVSALMTWQNQYNLTHLTVLKLKRALLQDLEAFEQVMVKKQNEKLKMKGNATAALPEANRIPRGKHLGAQIFEFLRKLAVRSFASVAKPTAALTRPTIP
jgi:hypothetical protein